MSVGRTENEAVRCGLECLAGEEGEEGDGGCC